MGAKPPDEERVFVLFCFPGLSNIISFYIWRNGDEERLTDLPKGTVSTRGVDGCRENRAARIQLRI